METGTLLDTTRLIVGIVILLYASYTDIKTRRASNILWLIMGSIGAIILIIQYFTIGFENIILLISIPLMIGFFYLLFQLRLIFGGADAKALMAISILAPLSPNINNLPLFNALPFFTWTIFANSVLLFLFIPLSLFFYNIAKKNIEFPYCVLGYKLSVKKAKEKFVWPLEQLMNGKRKFMFMPKEFDVKKELKVFEKGGITEIWVTPKIPFMIPLLAGFICSFIIGDILFNLMGLVI
jgi:preflagellin peptidase FlaK